MKAANALGAKTARACDSCLRRRARWFFAADDAFLCHGCDNLVHCANQFARRHERVRLPTASSSKRASSHGWYSGFTRKARNLKLALQQSKHEEEEEEAIFNSILPMVSKRRSEEGGSEKSDERLLCRVPVFDRREAELCDVSSEVRGERLDAIMKKDVVNGGDEEGTCDLDNFPESLSLLESGIDESTAELFDCQQEYEITEAFEAVGLENNVMVKIKDEDVVEADTVASMTSEVSNRNTQTTQAWREEDEHVESKGKIFYRLNDEDVITARTSPRLSLDNGKPTSGRLL